MQLDGREKADLSTIEKVMLMIYNKPFDMTREVFGDRHPSYLEDQQSRMINDFGKWWSRLDAAHRLRVVNVSDSYYSNEARNRIERY